MVGTVFREKVENAQRSVGDEKIPTRLLEPGALGREEMPRLLRGAGRVPLLEGASDDESFQGRVKR